MTEEYLLNKIVFIINAFGMAYYYLDESVSEECAQNVVSKLNKIGAAAELFYEDDRKIIYAFVPKKENNND